MSTLTTKKQALLMEKDKLLSRLEVIEKKLAAVEFLLEDEPENDINPVTMENIESLTGHVKVPSPRAKGEKESWDDYAFLLLEGVRISKKKPLAKIAIEHNPSIPPKRVEKAIGKALANLFNAGRIQANTGFKQNEGYEYFL